METETTQLSFAVPPVHFLVAGWLCAILAIQRVSAIGADVEEDADVATDSLPCSREGHSTSASPSCIVVIRD
jgi:hypothetical protein